ncbi:hypothetical protein [Nonomuraea sp. NPDC049504]|uniref:hypothetical protein n=1 Tax=Nonomuraea sp. NPDC049504 TaxID=3154729 RepID=UPI0034215DFA
MSVRSFHRNLRAATGTSPMKWLLHPHGLRAQGGPGVGPGRARGAGIRPAPTAGGVRRAGVRRLRRRWRGAGRGSSGRRRPGWA